MELIKKKVSELIPYINNSRTHSEEQITQLVSSIKEFGFTNPILLAPDNSIIAGHGRLQAVKKLGHEEVPCIVVEGLTKIQIKALIIADNQLALNAGWDLEKLSVEIEGLKDEDFNIDILGFNDDFIKDLLAKENNGLTDEDEVPEIKENPKSKLGDIFVLGNHRLMCADATISTDVEKLLNSQKADMIFTDPPYGVDYKGINNDSRDGLEELLRGSFANYFTYSKSGASIYCFHSDRCADLFHKVFREFFHFSSMIIWAKNKLTLSQTDYQSQHEPCLYGWLKNGTHSWHSDRKQTSVWKFDKETVVGHTTPKPVALVCNAINNSSKGDDIILDLFGGSGSTLIACEKLGRKANVMELDPKYCDVIIQRWQQFTGKEAIHEQTGKTYNSI